MVSKPQSREGLDQHPAVSLEPSLSREIPGGVGGEGGRQGLQTWAPLTLGLSLGDLEFHMHLPTLTQSLTGAPTPQVASLPPRSRGSSFNSAERLQCSGQWEPTDARE